MNTIRTIGRVAAVAGVTALLAGGLTGTATAEVTTPVPGAKFTGLQPAMSLDVRVYDPATGTTKQQGAGLMGLTTADGGIITVYCIEQRVQVTPEVNDRGGYVPGDWATYESKAPGWSANRDKVAWILANSYPEKSADEVLQAAGVTHPTSGTAQQVAAAATQAAIWHLTDGIAYDWTSLSDVRQVHTYLTEQAVDGTGLPPAVVGFDTSRLTQQGSIVGPVMLKNATSATLNSTVPTGFALTNAAGEAVGGTITAGQELYLTIPAGTDAGSLSLSFAATTTTLPQGSVWTNAWKGVNTQSLITAENRNAVSVTVAADFTWQDVPSEPTPEPEPTTPEPTTPQPEPTTPEPTTPQPEPTTPEPTTPQPEPTTPQPTTPEVSVPSPTQPAPVVVPTPTRTHAPGSPVPAPVRPSVPVSTAPASRPRPGRPVQAMVTRTFQVDRYLSKTAAQARLVARLDDDGRLGYREDRGMWGRSLHGFVTVTVPVKATKAQVIAAINAKTGKVGDVRTTKKVSTVRVGGAHVVAWELGRGATSRLPWGSKKTTAQIFFARS